MVGILAGYGVLDALWTEKTCGNLSQCLLSNSYPLLGSLRALFSVVGPQKLGLGWRHLAGIKAYAILDRMPRSTTGPLVAIASIYGTAGRASTGKYCVGDALSLSNAMELGDMVGMRWSMVWGGDRVRYTDIFICVQTR